MANWTSKIFLLLPRSNEREVGNAITHACGRGDESLKCLFKWKQGEGRPGKVQSAHEIDLKRKSNLTI